jgi:hypothetical protein
MQDRLERRTWYSLRRSVGAVERSSNMRMIKYNFATMMICNPDDSGTTLGDLQDALKLSSSQERF